VREVARGSLGQTALGERVEVAPVGMKRKLGASKERVTMVGMVGSWKIRSLGQAVAPVTNESVLP
jgi:hypothetical protein